MDLGWDREYGHEVLVVQEDGLIVMLDFFFAFGAPNIFGNISPVPVAMTKDSAEVTFRGLRT